MKKITLFAMTEKGYTVVSSLHANYPGIIDAVISSSDSHVLKDYYDEIKMFCRDNKIVFYNRSDSYNIKTEYSIAVSWRWLINAGQSRLIVFHDSLLPRYRGFNPLVTSLINGDTEIGVTALYARQEFDRGPIIARSASNISYPITIRDAIATILTNYSSLSIQIAECLSKDKEPTAMPQSEADASYSLWRDEDDYFIDWGLPATIIRRIIDALGFPYKSAASVLDGKLVRVIKAEVLDDVNIINRTPGKIIFLHDSKPVVVCGAGLLRIDELVNDSGSSILPLPRFRMRFKGLSKI